MLRMTPRRAFWKTLTLSTGLALLAGCPSPASRVAPTPFDPVIGEIVLLAPTGIPAGRYTGTTDSTTTMTVIGQTIVESTSAETSILIDDEGFYVSDAGLRPSAGESVEERTDAGRLVGVLTSAEIDAGVIAFHNAVQMQFDGPASQLLILTGESHTTYTLLDDGTLRCDALIETENTDDGPSIRVRIEGTAILTRVTE